MRQPQYEAVSWAVPLFSSDVPVPKSKLAHVSYVHLPTLTFLTPGEAGARGAPRGVEDGGGWAGGGGGRPCAPEGQEKERLAGKVQYSK